MKTSGESARHQKYEESQALVLNSMFSIFKADSINFPSTFTLLLGTNTAHYTSPSISQQFKTRLRNQGRHLLPKSKTPAKALKGGFREKGK